MARGRNRLLERLPKGIGAEVGVWQGQFSERLLKKATKLYLIDPWLHQPEFEGRMYAKHDQNYMDRIHDSVVEKFQDDNVEVKRGFSHEILPTFPDKFFDWIYIDGNHAHEWVKSDIEISLEKSNIVCGDDYSFGGVKEALLPYEVEVMGSQWMIKSSFPRKSHKA